MNTIKKSTANFLIMLCLGMALVLSGNAFAGKPGSGGYVIGGTGPGGGIIFHLTDDGTKGLEAAPEDQAREITWWNGEYLETNAARSGIKGGSFNMDRIISIQGQGNYAALIAANYNGGGYGDWYLPSKYELNLMYENLHKQGLGGFTFFYYWSSTESDAGLAWEQLFGNGSQPPHGKHYGSNVRAVRAF